jgi:hypothetical protein
MKKFWLQETSVNHGLACLVLATRFCLFDVLPLSPDRSVHINRKRGRKLEICNEIQEYQQGVLNEVAASSRNERSPLTCKISNINNINGCKRKPQMKDVFKVTNPLDDPDETGVSDDMLLW